MLIARIFTYRSDAYVFGRQWTNWDLFRLALWRTASSTLALLMVAVAMEELYARSFAGFGWLLGAGVVALIGKLRLRTAEGFIPRPVKSGELYKRALVLSKRMNVPLSRVCVVPFGRGHLTNAYGGRSQIAITDDYGHWLHGSQLDFVIGHELAHAKQNDALKTLATMAVIYATLAAATLLMSYLPLKAQFVHAFLTILLPLPMFYALSRHHEYVADRLSVEATGEPEMAIRALAGLYRHADVPAERSPFAELFSTHPALWRRINAIARLGGVSPEFLVRTRESFTEVVPDIDTSAIQLIVPPRTS
jgi:Zn-dependent protease with chaperone function